MFAASERHRWIPRFLLLVACLFTSGCGGDSGGVAYRADTLLVRYSPAVSAAERLDFEKAVGGRPVRDYPNVPGLVRLEVEVPVEEAVQELSARSGVLYAMPDYRVTADVVPADPEYPSLWGLHRIDAEEAWEGGTGDPGFVVAVIDEGVDVSHPDLAGNIWVNPGEIPGNGVDDDGNGYVDDIHGWDFFNDDASVFDGAEDDHGTHVAGTIAGVGNNGVGVTGVNWRAKIMVLKFLGPGGGYTSDAIAALEYATDKGVKVSNNSWGGGGYSQALRDAIEASQSVGHVFVAAAGNSAVDLSAPGAPKHYPACYPLPNILSVAALDRTDDLAYFSNRGYQDVDLAAPGVSILSTLPGDRYGWYQGTSMAAPHVAGVAALVYTRDPGQTYQQVIDRILDSVEIVPGLSEQVHTAGLLDAEAAVAPPNALPEVSLLSPVPGRGFLLGVPVNFSGSAVDAEDGDLSASLTWISDRDGPIGSGASFVAAGLSPGVHVVTAMVTDSGGRTGYAERVFLVNDPAGSSGANGRADG